MKIRIKGFILGFICLMIIGFFPNGTLIPISGHSSTADSYPPPETPTIPQETPNIPSQIPPLYLPIIMNPQFHYYAQAEHTESTIYGVWASIKTPDPKIREPIFSYVSINIIAPDGKWVETGVRKKAYYCVPRFIYAIQPGSPVTEFLSPAPTIGVSYQYKIEKVTDGLWSLTIMELNGIVIVSEFISNGGMNVGTKIQVSGEVSSPAKLNDLGISDVTSLKWKMANGNWSYWNSWDYGVYEPPPYYIENLPPFDFNNVRARGNNGNPVPPSAPCP
jgi:hypothetical protein